jgi:hypothetical protein
MPLVVHLSPPQKRGLLPNVGHLSPLKEREDVRFTSDGPTSQPYELAANIENNLAEPDSARADIRQDEDLHSALGDTESLHIPVRSSQKKPGIC